jgi:hypothetical protein
MDILLLPNDLIRESLQSLIPIIKRILLLLSVRNLPCLAKDKDKSVFSVETRKKMNS